MHCIVDKSRLSSFDSVLPTQNSTAGELYNYIIYNYKYKHTHMYALDFLW